MLLPVEFGLYLSKSEYLGENQYDAGTDRYNSSTNRKYFVDSFRTALYEHFCPLLFEKKNNPKIILS